MTPENPQDEIEVRTESVPLALETKIVGYCRACGKGLDTSNARHVNRTIYCEEHAPLGNTGAPPSPWTAAGSSHPPPLPHPSAAHSSSPMLAFFLGWIPGVGAIYNGQYAKGFVHALIFGLLISILGSNASRSLEPLFGLLIAVFIFYMAFEAYHTAKRCALGQPIDEWSGLVTTRRGSKFPAGPMVLIAVGVVFLLNNLGLWDFHRVARYWPAALIILGVYMLWSRLMEGQAEVKMEDKHGRE